LWVMDWKIGNWEGFRIEEVNLNLREMMAAIRVRWWSERQTEKVGKLWNVYFLCTQTREGVFLEIGFLFSMLGG
jgi:hypothetical protein